MLIAVAIVAMVMMGKKATPAAQTQVPQNQAENKEVAPTVEPKSLSELLASGLSQKCTYAVADPTNPMQGTVYIGGGKTRGDFTVNAGDKTINSHMIVDGSISYLWTDGQTQGIKMTFDPNAQPKSGSATQSSGVDLKQKFDYKCSIWSTFENRFELPTGVKFTDFSSMALPKTNPESVSPAVNKCTACSYLTGDQKTQCLSSMGCSN